MLNFQTLVAVGFTEHGRTDDGVVEMQKTIAVETLSNQVKSLFRRTDVEDSDVATVWVSTDGIGISVWDCNAHCGPFSFSDPMGRDILHDAGVD